MNRLSPEFPSRGLYAITDGPRADLLGAVQAALAGGARMLQYRDKTSDHPRRLAEAIALKKICSQWQVPLIINDDVALARASDANGVHLGEDDDDAVGAREQLGVTAIIGASCYDSLDRARAAVKAGADYIAFGAFFDSPTKPLARHASTELLAMSAAWNVPRVAIGGITPDNGATLVAAGAEYLAAISAVFGFADVKTAAQRFSHLYASVRKT